MKRGMGQGYVMSPAVFSSYAENIIRQIAVLEGMIIRRQNINYIRSADDIVLIDDSVDKFQRIMERVGAAGEEMGLKIKKKQDGLHDYVQEDCTNL